MALLFMDGFDANDGSLKWFNSIPGSSSTTRFSKGLSGSCSDGAGNPMKRYTTGTAQIFTGAAIYTSGGWASDYGMTFYGDAGATQHLTVLFTSTGIQLHLGGNGGTLLASGIAGEGSTGVYYNNTWYYLEATATIASSGGICQVRVNGATAINYTGNTKNGGTGTTIDVAGYLTGQWTQRTILYDDLYICDATGTTNNTFLGDVRVQTLFPAAAGSSTQLTPTGSANNYANVNDVPDSTATYNASTVVGNRDTYLMGQLLASTGTIYGLQDNVHAFKTDAGSANMKAALKSGTNLYYDATHVLGATNAWFGAVRETDPNTSAQWTSANLNSIEFGGEVA